MRSSLALPPLPQPTRCAAVDASRLPSVREAVSNALFPFVAESRLQKQLLLCRRLATLTRAGMPLYQALRSVLQTVRGSAMRRVLTDASRIVAEGGRLSDGLARFPETFTGIQLELLRAGETVGSLDSALDRMAAHLERELELRRFLSRQTLYPKIILVFGVVVIPAFFAFVMGGDFWGALIGPLTTALQLALLCAVAFAVGRTLLAHSPLARETYESLKWLLPGIGVVSRSYALARFGHALGSLYGAGVPLAAAVRSAGRASGSFRVAAMAEEAARTAECGEPIVPSMRQAGFIPEDMLSMLDTGLTTGNVDEMVERSSRWVEDEADTKAHKTAYIVSTIFFLLVACYVASHVPWVLP